MTIIQPQWQGAGITDQLSRGIETWRQYFGYTGYTELPLSEKKIELAHNIIGLAPILEQTHSFRKLLEEQSPGQLQCFAGDCGAEIIPVSYFNQRHAGKMAVVWLDAHADLNTPESSPSKAFHGMPLRTLLGEGNARLTGSLFSFLRPEQVFYAGLRNTDPPEEAYIKEQGIFHTATMDYVKLKAAIRARGFEQVYIHLDLDVFDPAAFSFVLFPEKEGATVAEVAALIKNLQTDFSITGCCITESTAHSVEALAALHPVLALLEK